MTNAIKKSTVNHIVFLSREHLVNLGACNGGLGLFDAIKRDQDDVRKAKGKEPRKNLRISHWENPLAQLWMAMARPDLHRWLVGRAILAPVSAPSQDLTNADLRSANLTNADLRSANLYGANLEGANLTRANLYGTYLEGANLTNANLSYANLSYADLEGAALTGARMALTQTLPTGWIFGSKYEDLGYGYLARA